VVPGLIVYVTVAASPDPAFGCWEGVLAKIRVAVPFVLLIFAGRSTRAFQSQRSRFIELSHPEAT
jgi:hypothetical protein